MLREALTLDRLRALGPDEAAALFVARGAEGLTASEESLLADWLAADRAHRHAFDRADRAWGAFAETEGDELLAAMREHALAAPAGQGMNWRRIAAVAAAVLLVVASGAFFTVLNRPPLPGTVTRVAALEYATGTGEVREIKLADGSTMTLDAESKALARIGAGERSIELVRGRALFEVASDEARPFTVTAVERRIVATGTRFEVDCGGGVLKVTLLKGSLRIETPGGKEPPVMLVPGQQFVDRGGAPSVRAVDAGSGDAARWRHGLVALDDLPLFEAVAELNRYSRNRIVIRDPAVGAMRISGQFRAGDAERFARTVAEVHPVRLVRRGDELELVREK